MVIAFDDEIPAALESQFDDLFERYEALKHLDDPHAVTAAAESIYRDATELDYPQLMVMALGKLYSAQWDLGARAESLTTYVRFNQIATKYRAALYPDLAGIARLYVVISLDTLLDMPDVPLSRIHALVDTVEQQSRAEGDPLDVAYLCRAIVAMQTGDPDGARRWREKWHAAEPYDSALPRVAAANLGASIAGSFDPQLAVAALETTGPYDAMQEHDAIALRSHRAFRLALVGRVVEAEEEAVAVMRQYPHDLIEQEATHINLLRALEGRGDFAELILGWMADDIAADAPAREYESQAIAARYFLRSAQTRERGLALKEVALRNAALFDARNGNTFVTDSIGRNHFSD
ncbi:hypothetical protein [Cumulibacter soli]|uniref:hypothetical protein n=1 Tax=Cumulibacter soli TaxID=2546344 RepID=UPI0010676DDF|nr:hypothetical protein [Cumulibacter soli]